MKKNIIQYRKTVKTIKLHKNYVITKDKRTAVAENNQVGEKIRKVRKCLGFSQEEFAFKVGVTKQTVSSWELGSAQPGFDKINFICQEFNIDANTFIYPIDKKNSDRKVVATTITNDIIFLPTPAVAETKSEVKLPMSKEKKLQ